MKTKLITLLTLVGLFLAFTPTSPAFERHPQIRAAMRALDGAKEHLEHAAHDFGGHRVDAIRAIDEAHHQLEVCLQY